MMNLPLSIHTTIIKKIPQFAIEKSLHFITIMIKAMRLVLRFNPLIKKNKRKNLSPKMAKKT